MSMYYVLKGKEIVKAQMLDWARYFEGDDRIIRQTTYDPNTRAQYDSYRAKAPKRSEDSILISTVFLGMDHSLGEGAPILFETMIFGGEHNDYQERYCTFEAAEKGHEAAVKLAIG